MRDSVARTICSYCNSHGSRVYSSHPCLVKIASRSCTTEGCCCWSKSLKRLLLALLDWNWLQPGPPEEADMRKPRSFFYRRHFPSPNFSHQLRRWSFDQKPVSVDRSRHTEWELAAGLEGRARMMALPWKNWRRQSQLRKDLLPKPLFLRR